MSEPHESTVTVAERWTYDWGARKKPAIHPLRAPSGAVLTTMTPADHPWHRGLWLTIKDVNGENFWEERPPYGVLRHTGSPSVEGPDERGRVTVAGTVRWTRPDRETTAVEEDRRLTHVPLGDDAYAIDVDITLIPAVDTIFDRTEFTTWGGYGGLALRGRPDWHDTRLLLGGADGRAGGPGGSDGDGQARVIGEPAPWCDLSGQVGDEGVASEQIAGIAWLDHPGNVRHPTPWYGSTRAATYGDEGWSNFLNAAFLFHEPLSVGAGEPLRLRYRVIVHDGMWDADRVDEAWDAYIAEADG